jgi:hypothetical protein
MQFLIVSIAALSLASAPDDRPRPSACSLIGQEEMSRILCGAVGAPAIVITGVAGLKTRPCRRGEDCG